jgi:HAD superfamily hydrolase (TIGR01509 family)
LTWLFNASLSSSFSLHSARAVPADLTCLQGLRKPSPESFAAVVSHLQLPPEGLLFVDDRQVNVDGALSAGIPSIRFESAAQLEAELRQRGFQL